MLSIEQFFMGYEASRHIFDALCSVIASVGPSEMRVTKSQIAFRRRVGFAWAWIPARYLSGQVAPLVLTVALGYRDESPRWKEIVEPVPGRFTHHLEIYSINDIDAQVREWLDQAWAEAG